jgi:hypothetical protein
VSVGWFMRECGFGLTAKNAKSAEIEAVAPGLCVLCVLCG